MNLIREEISQRGQFLVDGTAATEENATARHTELGAPHSTEVVAV